MILAWLLNVRILHRVSYILDHLNTRGLITSNEIILSLLVISVI